MLPANARKPFNINYRAHCQWCATAQDKSKLFKIRDGPLDWYFCNEVHAELWLEFRHKKDTYKLCRMPAKEKLEYLQGMSMEGKISRLLSETCAHKP